MTGRARRLLRLTLGLLAVAGFPLLVALLYRPAGARTAEARREIAETLRRESEGVRDRLRFEEFDYSESEGDAEVYRLQAAEAIAFADGSDRTFRLKDVRFTTRDAKSGRSARLEAPRAEFVPATKGFRVFDGVRVEGEGVGVRSLSFRYDPVTKVLASEGDVTALAEGLFARARQGSVETAAGVVRFRGDVRVGGEDARRRRLALTAEEVDLRRGGALAARGAVVLKTDQVVLRGAEAEREVGPGGSDRLTARGAVTALLVPGEGAGPRVPVRAEGETAELDRDAAGAPGRLRLAGRPARIDVPPEAQGGSRRATADLFEVGFAGGRPARANVPGPLSLLETAPRRVEGTERAAARLVTAGSGQLAFAGNGSTIETAVLEGGVAASEGTTVSIRAPRATLRGEDQSAVFAGTATEPARYEDPDSRVSATVLTWFRKDERIEGAGNVKTTFRGREGTEILGGEGNAPVFSESDFLRVLTKERQVLLTGNVTAWQEENVLRAQALRIDDRERSLRAEGGVRAVLRRRRVDPRTKAAVLETITASGTVLTHREAEKLVRIEGASSVVSGTWVMNADVTDVHLGPDRTVDHAEARGNVVIEDRTDGRRGEGAKATWRPQAESISLEGRPATALDGRGNRMTGARLTFQKGTGRVDVETGPGIPSQGIIRPEGT